MKAKSRYRLRGDPLYEAESVGRIRKDQCGQSPFLFVSGPWRGEVVFVEPFKMWKVKDRLCSISSHF